MEPGTGENDEHAPGASPSAAASPPRQKLAELIAQQVEREIMAQGWTVGESLGTEASLAKHYGVSRAVMREAIRILEHHTVVSSRRGAGGGIAVRAPEIEAVVPVTALYLDHEGVTPAMLFEARSAIELAGVALAAERMTDEKRARLEAAIALEAKELEDPHRYLRSHELHVLIAELTDNHAIRLFVSVLTRLTHEQAETRFATTSTSAALRAGRDISNAHRAIVDALTKGDSKLAQRRMLSHLTAITPWLT